MCLLSRMFPAWIPESMGHCTLPVSLKPNSKHEGISFLSPEGSLQVSVNAPAIENRANERCIALLAERLGVPKSRLRIIKGGRSRNKIIACEGISRTDAIERLKESENI